MIFRLLLLFTLVPLIELLLLLWLKDHTSWSFTISLVLLTGVVGTALTRWQGLAVVSQIQRDLRRGEMPADAMVHGLMILVAGALLVTPGVLTDVVGFLLLTPVFRRGMLGLARRGMRRRFTIHTAQGFQGFSQSPASRDEIIDVRVIDSKTASEPSSAR